MNSIDKVVARRGKYKNLSPLRAHTIALLLLALAVFVLGGCAGRITAGGAVSVVAPDFFSLGDELAERLVKNRRHSFGVGERLILASIVNLDDLRQTSSFGRSMSEAMATQLFQRGYSVVEVRKTPQLFIKDGEGELVLSRDARLLIDEHHADVILAGTYSLTPETVIVNLRLLRASSQEVISVAGLEVQRSHAINALIADNSGLADARLSGFER